MIACIVSYRSLFSPELKARKTSKPSTAALVNNGAQNNGRGITYTEASGGSGGIRQDGESFSSSHGGDGVEIVPLDMIYVRNDVAVDSHNCDIKEKGSKQYMTHGRL